MSMSMVVMVMAMVPVVFARSTTSPYSFSLSTFSPEGRLQQIEFAFKAVDHALPAAAMVLPDGIVIAKGARKSERGCDDSGGSQHLCRVAENVVATYSGLPADFRALVRKCQELAIDHSRCWGSDISVRALADDLATYVQEHTQLGGLRPFGASVLLAGRDDDGCCSLYRVDPSGWCAPWTATCVGSESVAMRDKIADKLEDEPSLEQARDFLVDLLNADDRVVATSIVSSDPGSVIELAPNAAPRDLDPAS